MNDNSDPEVRRVPLTNLNRLARKMGDPTMAELAAAIGASRSALFSYKKRGSMPLHLDYACQFLLSQPEPGKMMTQPFCIEPFTGIPYLHEEIARITMPDTRTVTLSRHMANQCWYLFGKTKSGETKGFLIPLEPLYMDIFELVQTEIEGTSDGG